MTRLDVVVVGLGALGSATAYALAKGGASVAAFEQYDLGHVRGASHDTSRILRRSYHLPAYVKLADAAYRDWADLEAAVGERLVTRTGGLTFCSPTSVVGIDRYTSSLDAHDVPYRVLDRADLDATYPQFEVPADVVALHQQDGSVVPAGRTTTILQMLAREQGAQLHAGCKVYALDPMDGGGVVVSTQAGRFIADRVVVCADAWTNALLEPLGARLPLVTTLEQVTYFAVADPSAFAPGRFPIWVWDEEVCYYGFPCFGEPTVKAARDCSGIVFDVEDRSFVPVPERLAELTAFVGDVLPAVGRPLRTVTCQYTLTPDRDFVLGPVPGHPDILLALGMGHAFKFAPTIGRVMAELVTTGTTSEDVSAFQAGRAGMHSLVTAPGLSSAST